MPKTSLDLMQGTVAVLILKAAGMMALGGFIVNVIARRFLGVGEKQGAS